MEPLVSVVIATFNRANCVTKAIDSVLSAFSGCCGFEVVIVDDNSSDNTGDLITALFKQEIETNTFQYIRLATNRGVSGARNVGIKSSHGKWVVFLDSDDLLIESAGRLIIEELQRYSTAPIIFFRCVDQDGANVGTEFAENSRNLGLSEFLQRGSSGESLVAVKRELILQCPFVEYLRGYEGLTIARILRGNSSPAILSSVIARRYIQSGEDRLSGRAGFAGRMHLIAQGHWNMATEFHRFMPLITTLTYLVKSIIYKIRYFFLIILKKTR